jgi:predicted Rossmann-fold nucleotide-binding protein
MCDQFGNISPNDLDLIKLFDTADEVVEYINEFYSNKRIMPNF